MLVSDRGRWPGAAAASGRADTARRRQSCCITKCGVEHRGRRLQGSSSVLECSVNMKQLSVLSDALNHAREV